MQPFTELSHQVQRMVSLIGSLASLSSFSSVCSICFQKKKKKTIRFHIFSFFCDTILATRCLFLSVRLAEEDKEKTDSFAYSATTVRKFFFDITRVLNGVQRATWNEDVMKVQVYVNMRAVSVLKWNL